MIKNTFIGHMTYGKVEAQKPRLIILGSSLGSFVIWSFNGEIENIISYFLFKKLTTFLWFWNIMRVSTIMNDFSFLGELCLQHRMCSCAFTTALNVAYEHSDIM